MLRKGYRPPVESIPSVLRIHNAVNERSWHQVRRWEKEVHDNAEPRLVKFVGRPKDLSPRAWFNSRVLMTGEPFDRHDWYVEDANGGEPRRYVIDFYEGKEGGPGGGVGVADRMSMANKPPSMYIDVRPALDGPSAAVDRMTMFAREALPGLASAWDAYGKSSSSSSSSSSPAASSTSSSSGGGVRVAGMEDGAGAGEVDGIRKR
jgi:cytochrome c heme-lyase